jgi:aspartate aminotransferase
MTALQSHTTSNAAAVSQHAAVAALTSPAEATVAVESMVRQFQARRDAALAILRQEPRLHVIEPDGAFYLYIRVPGAGLTADAGSAFATYLLEHANVAIVPGSAFGTPDWVRVSYAAEQSAVEEAMRRIVVAYRALS